MKIYYLFLILSLFTYAICNRRYKLVNINGFEEKRAYLWQGIILFIIIIVFCGLRSGIADTGTYIAMFNDWPTHISNIDWSTAFDDKGFYFLTVLYRQFISTDFHGWLFIISLISSLAIMRAFLKFSCDFGMSCFLFVASTTFTYLINGMRQFIAVAILLNCIDFIIERKPLYYIISVLLLSTIHMSAIILLPFYFIIYIKPWSKFMWFIVISICVVGVFFNKFTFLFELLTNDTQYAGYLELLSGKTGVNIIRIFIALIPVLIAFLGRKYIQEVNSPIINISIVMSAITASLYFIAYFTNGMVIGRLLIYFEVYNLILLPWLINHCFEKTSSKIIKFFCFSFYILFFFVQMQLTWHIGYISDVLNIYLW